MLKRSLIICLFLLGTSFSVATAQLFDKLKKEANKLIENPKSLTQDDAANGLKEALIKGVSNGSDIVSKLDGYNKNPEIKIPFPQDAKKVETTLRSVGLSKQVDDAVLSLNRAAEDAAKEAKPIFIAAVKKMTFDDAITIVKGNDNAATTYLNKTTSPELRLKFKPVIQKSLEKVDATKHWATVMNSYNRLPFIEKINPDLTDYVTQKAIDGLFVMIAKEELDIRKNPAARTSDILIKVFGKK